MCLEDRTTELYSYRNRLKTYVNWQGLLTPESLAFAGFFYTKRGDMVACPFCRIEVFQWRHDDSPLREHEKYSKDCKFVVAMNKKLQ